MEEKKKKVNWSKVIGWALAITSSVIALKQKERADKLEGEIINLRRQVKGQQRTINILNYEKGKDSILK